MANVEDFSVATAAVQGKHNGDACVPEFRMKAVLLEHESEQAGKQIWRNVEYVTIHIPGDNRSTVDRKVTDEHRRRWPVQYAAWKENREIAKDGLPLEKWSLIGPAEVETFKFFKVRTVEELAQLSDTQCQNLGRGAIRLRKEAQAFLEQAKGNAGISKSVAEVERLEIRVAQLETQLAEALARLAAVKTSDGEVGPLPPARGALDDAEPAPRQRRARGKASSEHKSALEFEQTDEEAGE